MRARDLATLELPRLLESIADLTRSTAGRRAVRELRPAATVDEANRRLDVLGEAIERTRVRGRPPTGDVPDVAPILAAAAPEGAALEARRLAELADVVGVAKTVHAWLAREPEAAPALAGLADELPLAAEVDAALACTLDERGLIRDDASPELAAARIATRELRAQLETRLLRLVREPDMATTVTETYVTVRNGRFVVPIRTAAAPSVAGVVQDRSASGETVFIEPLFAVDLNNRLLLAAKDEEAEERRVRAELTTLVRAHAAELATLERRLADVDALGAAAVFSLAHACARPALGAPDVALAGARHPLLLVAGRHAVPLDVRLRADQRGLAITGPNAGGKTVTLKTLGVCALMANAGLFIPAAEGSRLPFFDAVLVDIGDEQSIERDLSTFSGHAANLAAIAAAATPGALVLLDEPGVGTDPVEGAALAVGVVTDLLERGPRVVLTSHYAQVKTFALSRPDVEVAAFDVDPDTGAPRFVLVYHSVGQSLALPIARRHGIPERALQVAEGLLAGDSLDLGRAIARLEESRREYERRRDAADAERAGLAQARADADALAADLRARQRRRWSEDLAESREFLRDVRARGAALLDALREQPERAALRTFVEETEAAIASREAATAEPERPGKAPARGDQVEVVGRGIRGELVEIDGPRARIQRGGLRFEVPASQLRVVAAERPTEKVVVDVTPAPETAPDEINLVGRRTREAVDALATFLDRAVRAGASEVRVVHGIGTGALRRAVQEFLATSPYCAGYRDADVAAGGAGVTIADLR